MDDKVRLCEVLDKLLESGVVIAGDVKISVAGIDLIYLRLGILLCSAENLACNSQKGGDHAS